MRPSGWSSRSSPPRVLDAQDGPLAAVKALAAAGKLADLKGICFTGLKACREFTLALGLAALGLKVAGRRAAAPLGERNGPHGAQGESWPQREAS